MSAAEPRTVEQIAQDYQLPIDAVKEAIAYCQEDPPEIRKDMAEEEAIMELLGMNDPHYKENPRPRQVDPAEIVRTRRSIGE